MPPRGMPDREGTVMVLGLLSGTKKLIGTTAGSPTSSQQGYAPVLTRPQLVAMLTQSAHDVGCTMDAATAEMIIQLWARARADADGPERPGGRRIETLLTDEELRGVHEVMDVLMPDDVAAEPSTVHYELDRYTFGVGSDGRPLRGVMHTMDSTDQCAVVATVIAAA